MPDTPDLPMPIPRQRSRYSRREQRIIHNALLLLAGLRADNPSGQERQQAYDLDHAKVVPALNRRHAR